MSQPSVHELYRLVSRVGKGAYGSVYKGEHIPTGKVVAIKSIDFDNANGDDDVADIQREVSLLTQLRDCPNITKYYGCYLHKAVLWIVMEFAQGGSVDSVMKASPNGCIKELHAAIIIREILIALAYLHKVPVIHRDIKSANILITAAGNVLLCDFGVSALLATSVSKRLTFTGTLHFMAPEVLQEYAYDTKADIWSLGGVVHEMIKGKPPFYHLTNAHDAIQQIPRSSPPRFTENEASKQLREFMGYCLKESPAERLSADELLKTPWIKSTKASVSVLKELISTSNDPRLSMAESLDWDAEAQVDDDVRSSWAFETFRSRAEDNGESTPLSSTTTTVKNTNMHSFPMSLRTLFEEETATPDFFQQLNLPNRDMQHRGRVPPEQREPVFSFPDKHNDATPQMTDEDDNSVTVRHPLKPQKSDQESLLAYTMSDSDSAHDGSVSGSSAEAGASTDSLADSSDASLTSPLASSSIVSSTPRRARAGPWSKVSNGTRPLVITDIRKAGKAPTTPLTTSTTPPSSSSSAPSSAPSSTTITPLTLSSSPTASSVQSTISTTPPVPSSMLPASSNTTRARERRVPPPSHVRMPSTRADNASWRTLKDAPLATSPPLLHGTSVSLSSSVPSPSPLFSHSTPILPHVPPLQPHSGAMRSRRNATALETPPPPIVPLDYASLMDSEAAHATLARTIDDLSQWLATVENGLGSLLEQTVVQ